MVRGLSCLTCQSLMGSAQGHVAGIPSHHSPVPCPTNKDFSFQIRDERVTGAVSSFSALRSCVCKAHGTWQVPWSAPKAPTVMQWSPRQRIWPGAPIFPGCHLVGVQTGGGRTGSKQAAPASQAEAPGPPQAPRPQRDRPETLGNGAREGRPGEQLGGPGRDSVWQGRGQSTCNRA